MKIYLARLTASDFPELIDDGETDNEGCIRMFIQFAFLNDIRRTFKGATFKK